MLAVAFRLAQLDVLFNLAKIAALLLLGFWFLSYFEQLSWAVLIAVVIPFVDAISVWKGPTQYVVEQQPQVFDNVSIAFRVPGEDASANLGPPDVLFFALYLAAAQRFGLRVGWTWLSMVALLGLTLALAATTSVAGLPALPAVCIGFLLPNVDLIWRELGPLRAKARNKLLRRPEAARSGSSPRSISYDGIDRSLLEAVPEFQPVYDEHLRDYDEVLPHVLFADLLRFTATALGHDDDDDRAARILAFLETAMAEGDERTRELIAVSFVEHLGVHPGEERVRLRLGPLLRAELERQQQTT